MFFFLKKKKSMSFDGSYLQTCLDSCSGSKCAYIIFLIIFFLQFLVWLNIFFYLFYTDKTKTFFLRQIKRFNGTNIQIFTASCC